MAEASRMECRLNNTLHFCWLVDPWKKSREKYLQAWQDFGWKCVLWHNGQLGQTAVETPAFGWEADPNLPRFELATSGVELRHISEIIPGSIIEDVFNYELKHHSHAACADLLRYLLLYELGGAYSDIDVTPGVNALPSLPNGPLFGASLPRRLEIRFIRSAAKHPMLLEILEAAVRNEQRFIGSGGYLRGYANVVDRTGPVVADAAVEAYAKRQGRTIQDYILPKATFDFTIENRNEGHHLRVAEILSLVEKPLWGSEARWRYR